MIPYETAKLMNLLNLPTSFNRNSPKMCLAGNFKLLIQLIYKHILRQPIIAQCDVITIKNLHIKHRYVTFDYKKLTKFIKINYLAVLNSL